MLQKENSWNISASWKIPGKVVTLQKGKDRFSSPMNGFHGGTLGCFLFGGVFNLKRNSNSGTLHNHDMAWWASCFRCPRCLLFWWPGIPGCVNSKKSRQKVSTDLSWPFFDLQMIFCWEKTKQVEIDWHFLLFFCSACVVGLPTVPNPFPVDFFLQKETEKTNSEPGIVSWMSQCFAKKNCQL